MEDLSICVLCNEESVEPPEAICEKCKDSTRKFNDDEGKEGLVRANSDVTIPLAASGCWEMEGEE